MVSAGSGDPRRGWPAVFGGVARPAPSAWIRQRIRRSVPLGRIRRPPTGVALHTAVTLVAWPEPR